MAKFLNAIVKRGTWGKVYSFAWGQRSCITCLLDNGEQVTIWDLPATLAPYRKGDSVIVSELDGKYRIIGNSALAVATHATVNNAVQDATNHLLEKVKDVEQRLDELATEMGAKESSPTEGNDRELSIEDAFRRLLSELDKGDLDISIHHRKLGVILASSTDEQSILGADYFRTESLSLDTAIRKHFAKMIAITLNRCGLEA